MRLYLLLQLLIDRLHIFKPQLLVLQLHRRFLLPRDKQVLQDKDHCVDGKKKYNVKMKIYIMPSSKIETTGMQHRCRYAPRDTYVDKTAEQLSFYRRTLARFP